MVSSFQFACRMAKKLPLSVVNGKRELAALLMSTVINSHYLSDSD